MPEDKSTLPRVGSALVITNSRGEVLLGKTNKSHISGQWILPGGGVNAFESIEQAAKREAREELGIEIEILTRLGTYELITEHTHRIINYSIARLVPEDQHLKPSSDLSEARFFSKVELQTLQLNDLMKKVLADAGILAETMHNGVEVKISTSAPDLPLPSYSTEGSAAADARAAVQGEVTISPGQRSLIPTGLHFEIPHGYEIQVRPRSGLALEYGITFPNSPGTIDSDYRGELKIIIQNLGDKPFTVRRGDRIAQLILARVHRASFTQAEKLAETKRAEGGFGSTGR